MDKPTKALILGVVVGALAAGVGLTNSHRLERKVQELQTRCVAEQEKEAKSPPPPHVIWDDELPPKKQQRVIWDDEVAAEQEKEAKSPGEGRQGRSWLTPRPIDIKLLCDPVELARSNGKLVGIQEELATAQRELWEWKRWPISGGLAITVFFALPWVWYFLLRRVRELREALIGK